MGGEEISNGHRTSIKVVRRLGVAIIIFMIWHEAHERIPRNRSELDKGPVRFHVHCVWGMQGECWSNLFEQRLRLG